MRLRNLRVENTVIDKDTGKETSVSLEMLSLIKMYEDKGSGNPYEYKEVDEDWLLDNDFIKVSEEDDVYGKDDFFLVKTIRGWEYIANIIDFKPIGRPMHYCHEIENLYSDLKEEEE